MIKHPVYELGTYMIESVSCVAQYDLFIVLERGDDNFSLLPGF